MTTATDNPLWGPLERAMTLASRSETFQTLRGVADSYIGTPTGDAFALAAVYCPTIRGGAATIKAARPFIIIAHGDDRDHRGAWAGEHADSGSIAMLIEADVPVAHAGDTTAKHADAYEWFCTQCGAILADLMSESADGSLNLVGWSVEDPPERSDDETRQSEGDFFQGFFVLHWGGQS